MKYRGWWMVLTLSCTSPNPALVHENCGAQVSCPFGSGSYRACADSSGTTCSFVASDGRSFECASCSDCSGAAGDVTRWCSGGGTTGGGTTGGGTTGGGTTGGGTTGGGTTGGGTTGGGTTGGGTTGGSGVACPSVLIILDRSGSMADTPDMNTTGTTKIDVAKSAIATLVQQHGDHFAFGLEDFTSDDVTFACDTGANVLVNPAVGTSGTIQTQLTPLMPGGSTNTGTALTKANTVAALNDTSRPSRSILLITDGVPNCAGDATDLSGAIAQVQAASQKGISTFVLGLGTLVDPDKSGIDQIAAADPTAACTGTSCTGDHYYPAVDAGTLASFLDSIVGRLDNGSCNR